MYRKKLLIAAALACMPVASFAEADPLRAGLSLDELEYILEPGEDEYPMAWSAAAFLGTERHQLWLVSEGGQLRGALEESEMRAYYSYSLLPDWQVKLGWRGDVKPEPGRNWFLLGLEGEGPYQIGAAVTLYGADGGDTALRLELEREYVLPANWLLTPGLKMDFYEQKDPETGVGSGLSKAEVAVRLAYEWSPAITPYLGATWEKHYGQTEEYQRAVGEGGSSAVFLLGISIAF